MCVLYGKASLSQWRGSAGWGRETRQQEKTRRFDREYGWRARLHRAQRWWTTEAQSERMFSSAGQVVTKGRNMLSDKVNFLVVQKYTHGVLWHHGTKLTNIDPHRFCQIQQRDININKGDQQLKLITRDRRRDCIYSHFKCWREKSNRLQYDIR